jgi:phosphoglycolate phosphatase-like HAD superfamily hydrolase
MKTLLLFDIDATRQAMNKAFSELFGLKNPQQNVPFAGRTDLGIFKDVALTLLGRPLSGEELKQVADRYLELLPEELDRREFRLMPGVTQLLPVLAARKEIILGLETGNLESAAYMKLKRGGMDRYFSLGGFGSDSEDRAELVRKGVERARNLNHGSILDDNIFLIGDSPYDIIAGRKAGINTIGVCTGHADRNILLAESPSYVLSDLSDILAFLRCIGF